MPRKIILSPKRIGELAKAAAAKVISLGTIAARRLGVERDRPGPKVWRTHKFGPTSWAESGRWARVKSSNVQAIKYDKDAEQLFVRFKPKGHYPMSGYVYYSVSVRTAKDMFRAASMGKFVWKQLRDRYSYARIE